METTRIISQYIVYLFVLVTYRSRFGLMKLMQFPFRVTYAINFDVRKYYW